MNHCPTHHSLLCLDSFGTWKCSEGDFSISSYESVCPNCGHVEHVFGEGGAKRMSETYHVPVLGQLPLDAKIREQADGGMPTVAADPDGMVAGIYREIALKAAAGIAKTAKDMSLKMPSIKVEND